MAEYRVLITGANSGLGFSTCCRLLDEFLATRQSSHSLHLIFTTRDKRKGDDTLCRLHQHLKRTIRNVYGSDPKTSSIREMQEKRIRLEGELTDLCSLISIKRLARRLTDRGVHLDVVILNAGIGGWSGMDWPRAIWGLVTNLIEACTLPDFKVGYVGRLARAQLSSSPLQGSGEKDLSSPSEPPLGETFTANVFGHYMLVHWLAPVLQASPSKSAARIIWVSSIEAMDSVFDPDDLQAITTSKSYESSKRLTDLLVLTSERPSTRPYVASFFSSASSPSPATSEKSDTVLVNQTSDQPRPKMYLSHPGVCVTSIAQLPRLLLWLNTAALYLVRWIGSPWHPIQPYVAAVSTVWLALAAPETLDTLEGDEGKAKWGAATDRIGNERVVRTEVDGWGWGGRVGETGDVTWKLSVRRSGARGVSKEGLESFEELGGRCWREMEALREEWEKRLDGI